VRVLIRVGQGTDRWFGILRNISLGNLEEDKLAGLSLRAGAAAKITGGESVAANRGDGVVGVKLPARTAVGVHVRENADGGRVAGLHLNDAVLVSRHSDRSDLIDLERHVQPLVRNGAVRLCIDNANPYTMLLRLRKRRCQRKEEQGRGGSDYAAWLLSDETREGIGHE